MGFTWFKVFNKEEFEAKDVPSENVTMIFEGKGQKSFMITKGDSVSIVIDGVMLPVKFANKNPWSDSGFAVFLDDAQDVYLGFEVAS